MLLNFKQNIKRFLSRMSNYRLLSRFHAHNRKQHGNGSKNGQDGPIMLMELNDMHSAHIAYAFLAEEMAKRSGAQIKAYFPKPLSSKLQSLRYFFMKLVGWDYFGLYRSFGVSDFIRVNLTGFQKQEAQRLFLRVANTIVTKRDLEDLKIDGIWIGDLVYDTYLRRYSLPTIDPASQHFHDFLLESIETFVFWNDYIEGHDICAVNVSHCVYNLAIPLRIAVQKGIAVFQVNVTHVYRLSKDNLFAYNDFFNFRERFAALPEDVRTTGLGLAEKRIMQRFAGKVGVDMSYSTKSAYGAHRHGRLLRESNKKKILIATHCFFDSPHSYGKNLFPDFYEWLEFLGAASKKTDYDWYIKTHPDYLSGTKEIIDDFVMRFPKFSLLPSDASHLQIIDEGIDVALTCYGTIGFEYAALGVPVINASMNNPHIAYNFNIHARDVDHYRKLLENLNQLELNIDKNEVHEYYFMRNIFNTENLFFEDYKDFIKRIGGYSIQFSPAAYREWLVEWSTEKHNKILTGFGKFIDSKDFRMDYRHFDEEFTLKNLEKFL